MLEQPWGCGWGSHASLWFSWGFWKTPIPLNKFVFCLNQPEWILVFATESLTDKYNNLAFKNRPELFSSHTWSEYLGLPRLVPMEE